VKIGLLLTAQHAPEDDPVTALSSHLVLTRAARESGLESVFVSQTPLGEPAAALHPVPLLARLAAECEGMRLGTAPLLTALLNPLEVAQEVLTLDALSGGHFVLGVGTAYRDEERSAFGSPDRAAQVFVDKLDVTRRLLSGDEVTAAGPGYRLERTRLALRSVQRPRPPIWMAASTDAGVVRAARNADTWMMGADARVGELVPRAEQYRRARGASPYTTPICREVCVAPTDLEAVGMAREPLLRAYGAHPARGANTDAGTPDSPQRAWDDLRMDRFILGSPETVIRKLLDLRRRLGATDVLARVTWPGFPLQYAERSVRLLGTKVLAALAK
jgi:alkanesulfonate monooxygenase SsuD/methylene tetrahydromethanopterin reductase-like flavin-dependent oxidoreductase (luciferase family)